jgi:cobalt-zinc-cadmium efflux system membrane fusion protein
MHRSLVSALLLFALPLLAEEARDGMIVQVPPALGAKITVQPVEVATINDVLRLPGRVALDEHRVARIGPSISGKVVEIKAFIGRDVHKGEPLALLNSTELSNTQAAYLKARTKMGLQRLAVDRARRLFHEGIISEATLKEREGGLAEADVEVRAVADQLTVMGMNPEALAKLTRSGQINSLTPVSSTLSGTVIDRHISVGQIAEISDDLFTVADLKQVWVVAEAPEQDAHVVEVGSRVDVLIPALPNEKITGKIIYIADTVKPETRTVTMRMALDNPKRQIKPEMLADMLIRHRHLHALTVPSQAVIREADRDHVFVELAPDRFALRPVTLEEDRDGQRHVLVGLAEGDRIVTDGAFHLNNVRVLKTLE